MAKVATSNKTENILLTGIVEDTSNGILKVTCNLLPKHANCRISGKMKQNRIKVVKGDTVDFEVSPYDNSEVKNGIIVKRHKN